MQRRRQRGHKKTQAPWKSIVERDQGATFELKNLFHRGGGRGGGERKQTNKQEVVLVEAFGTRESGVIWNRVSFPVYDDF